MSDNVRAEKKHLRALMMEAASREDYDTASYYRERTEQLSVKKVKKSRPKDNQQQYWDEPVIAYHDPYTNTEIKGILSQVAAQLEIQPTDVLEDIAGHSVEVGNHLPYDSLNGEAIIMAESRVRKQRMIYMYNENEVLVDYGPTSYFCERYQIAANTLTCRVRDGWADGNGNRYYFAREGQLRYYGGEDLETNKDD